MITHLHGAHFADIPFLMTNRFFYQIQSSIQMALSSKVCNFFGNFKVFTKSMTKI